MNARENYARFLAHEDVEWIPNMALDTKICGGRAEYWENGPVGDDGEDGFGVKWVGTHTSAVQPTVDSTYIALDDICDWEDKVIWPDLDKIDWKNYAEAQLAGYDRSEKPLEYHSWNSIFERMAFLLGFEEGLCAFYEEPEAMHALLEAITDYKIRLLDYVDKYFKPDVFVHYDDVATARSLFMSPECYREFIKPCHKRLNDAAYDMGIIPCTHICGYVEDIIGDLCDEGSTTWQSAQPVNDICKIIEDYGDRISVVGGFDSNGAPGMIGATDEQIIEEVDRCYETYGRYGHSFAFFGFFVGQQDNPQIKHQYSVLFKESGAKGHEVLQRLRTEGKLAALVA